jgi:signal peptidase
MASATSNQDSVGTVLGAAEQVPRRCDRRAQERGQGRSHRHQAGHHLGKSCLRALSWIVAITVALMVAVLAFLYLSPTYNAYIVRSESMTPTLNLGDMVVVGTPGGFFSHHIAPGTIITYRLEGSVVTHRVQSMDGNSLITKGDAVEKADPQMVPTSQVVGVFLFKIPKLGYLSAFLHTKIGWFLLIIVPAGILITLIVLQAMRSAGKPRSDDVRGIKICKEK